ncbi:YfhE family protein [Oceanobacillus halophilus]|uniref:YfhE family protein n=1 Tax=Oceanobacillus halophilus TaxID=930130 RepID=A0A494ZR64_9BACI|nr:YfhE family protein [Oceanobacillus halophilus]RKQ28204.1 YfhE family protein [Oceanobacillus halophilus]
MRRNIQYQPTKNQQLTDAQEVHYSRKFKRADIAGGYRKSEVIEAKNENPNQLK